MGDRGDERRCRKQSAAPGELLAYKRQRFQELWDSATNASRDGFGNFAKFVPPLVVNGKVYVATQSNQVAVYGLLVSYTALPTSLQFPNQFVGRRVLRSR